MFNLPISQSGSSGTDSRTKRMFPSFRRSKWSFVTKVQTEMGCLHPHSLSRPRSFDTSGFLFSLHFLHWNTSAAKNYTRGKTQGEYGLWAPKRTGAPLPFRSSLRRHLLFNISTTEAPESCPPASSRDASMSLVGRPVPPKPLGLPFC